MVLPFVFSSGISFSSALTGPKLGNFTAVRGFSFFKFGTFSGSSTVLDTEVGTGPRMNSMSRLLNRKGEISTRYQTLRIRMDLVPGSGWISFPDPDGSRSRIRMDLVPGLRLDFRKIFHID